MMKLFLLSKIGKLQGLLRWRRAPTKKKTKWLYFGKMAGRRGTLRVLVEHLVIKEARHRGNIGIAQWQASEMIQTG
jgi:uncharacterized damage-inducible protein DinB